jgi:hypothetical protein
VSSSGMASSSLKVELLVAVVALLEGMFVVGDDAAIESYLGAIGGWMGLF